MKARNVTLGLQQWEETTAEVLADQGDTGEAYGGFEGRCLASKDQSTPSGPEYGRYPWLDDLPKSRIDDSAEVPSTADGLDQARGKLVHVAGETSARVNSKADIWIQLWVSPATQ